MTLEQEGAMAQGGLGGGLPSGIQWPQGCGGEGSTVVRGGSHLQAFLDIMIHNNFFMNIGYRPLLIILSLSIFEMQRFYAS